MAKKRDTGNWKEYIAQNAEPPKIDSLWIRELDDTVRSIPRAHVRSIFEIGCSAGRILMWMRKIFPRASLHGIDIEDAGRSILRKRRIAFRVADARNIPHPDGAFDLTLSMGVIEHFSTRAERQRLIEEQYRVTAPGGYVFLTTPALTRWSIMYWYTKIIDDRRHDYKHYAVSRAEVVRVLRRAGATIERAKYVGWFFEPKGVPVLWQTPFTSQVMLVLARKPAQKIVKKRRR
jgi:SAM-dependent methyltransferase